MSSGPGAPVFMDAALLDAVSAAAGASPRRRKNHNFHPRDNAVCHRLLNALEPDSYVPPHRHLDAEKDETFVVLRGRIGVVCFDHTGRVSAARVLEPAAAVGVTLPAGTWHTLVALEAGTVVLEAKAGPFVPLTPDERARWAPAEGEAGAGAFLEGLRALFR
ncbi:MAG: WbuC family cupin fold metalloprotein [Betaproteobacteria bacterium]|jgi:cupin fold WbuC family metalloprotein|nr:WbuC family cupin fold metalloprotein [Rhodocyclaceae bacterium]MCA3135491.1 WbuC family cupin fold metalloprotein [Rhodocyclaceae bacterium]MCA3142910.1 WbuC family cupin fold metalloprotein [Rhodocyclaceae bacterium]MCA3144930.1 WbuC family cupin fold metalloprotein [Rhodocyclaceae bacterium]MCE2898484.1 WbuC family cupin fold metalloprotein [Betaproteobacteria bacterium]